MSKNAQKVFYAVLVAEASGMAVFEIVVTAIGDSMVVLAFVGGVVTAIAAYGERGEKMKEAEMLLGKTTAQQVARPHGASIAR